MKREEEKDVLKEQSMEVSPTQKNKQVRHYFVEFDYRTRTGPLYAYVPFPHCVHLQSVIGKFLPFYKRMTIDEEKELVEEPKDPFERTKKVTKQYLHGLLLAYNNLSGGLHYVYADREVTVRHHIFPVCFMPLPDQKSL